ncbi:Phytochrome, two-component sensor histidine kinase [Cystobacter fuscus]|uniref:histidine kinase n=1 Tax=Cystobacter fuscus TaxID=43 RepID=A0A250IYH4_9BACT|nr:ATP-binding protein [Cystobacter fuscus]ATB36789.1 Phytochrome, two-component sensor histidine kinase [Cystobacter fuscus]
MSTESVGSAQMADLTNCDKEPIHIPGAIQPHGVLLVLREPSLIICQSSENTEALLGCRVQELLGRSLDSLLPASEIASTRASLLSDRLQDNNPLKLTLHGGERERLFNGIAHRHQGRLFLELEPVAEPESLPFSSFYQQARGSMSRLRDAKDLRALCEEGVREVRRLTGFDRVIIYRFDPDWNGQVLAEDRRETADPYLGLHFPASDIPRQARELYVLNLLRIIAAVDYVPARIVSLPEEATQGPLDMSFCVLRSVSPIHLEYLRNMGAGSSMSISLLQEGRLWGLISCTHMSGSKYVPYEVRTACEFVGQFMSSFISSKEGYEHYDQRIRTKSIQGRLLERMTRVVDFAAELCQSPPELLELTGASGAAVYFNGRMTIIGKAPEDEQLQGLIRWLSSRPASQDVFATSCLLRHYPESEGFKDVAAGLIAASMSRGRHNYVLWFRPEVVQTVEWGGNPHKPVDMQDDQLRLHPRKSFALWKETVRGKSLPWKDYELEAARELRRNIIDVVLERSEELLKLNTELKRSNVELDSFAYAASHDLKEPLRGIHNYASLVLREDSEALRPSNRTRMDTVVRLTQRMESLINSLLHYSQVGRMELSLRETDLNDVLSSVLEVLKPRIEEARAEVRVPEPLLPARCDRVRMMEVFTNLITNALKYNDKEKKWVEIGARRDPELGPVYYVRDNGIGIKPEYHEAIFRIFKRLHGRDKYGGGTGTGLTIVKRLIERHNGRIWVESTHGEGTAFFFTLDSEKAPASELRPFGGEGGR